MTKKNNSSLFVIGGGTSLERALNDERLFFSLRGKKSIGCNKSAPLFECDYMVFVDNVPFGHKYNHVIHNFYQNGGVVYAPPFTRKPPDLEFVNYIKSSKTPSADFENGVYYGNNSGVFAMCLAVAMGAKHVYLCGMDCRYNKDLTESHCHEGYGKPVNESNENTYASMKAFFESAAKHITEQYPDVTLYLVVDTFDDSLIDIEELYFKRITYKEALIA